MLRAIAEEQHARVFYLKLVIGTACILFGEERRGEILESLLSFTMPGSRSIPFTEWHFTLYCEKPLDIVVSSPPGSENAVTGSLNSLL